MNKICEKCKIEKSFDDFGKDKSKIDNKLIYCKTCHREIQKEYYKQNKEKLKLKQKLFRLNHKTDLSYIKRKKEYNKKYRLQHNEKIKKATLQYRLTHKNELIEKRLKNRDVLLARRRELRRQHYLENPAFYLLEASKDRARQKGLEHSITIDNIKIPSVCPVLGIPLKIGEGRPTPNSPSIDRIDNKKGYTPENIIIVSWRANDLKRNATIEELEKIINFYKGLQHG